MIIEVVHHRIEGIHTMGRKMMGNGHNPATEPEHKIWALEIGNVIQDLLGTGMLRWKVLGIKGMSHHKD